MKTANLKLKDGRQIVGYRWEWKPLEGYLTVVVEGDDSPVKVEFKDIESGTIQRSVESKAEMEQIIKSGSLGSPTEDILDYARKCGWQE